MKKDIVETVLFMVFIVGIWILVFNIIDDIPSTAEIFKTIRG